jgi:hypothetical protein
MKTKLSKVVVGLAVLGILGLHVPDADARGRVRFKGTGLARGAHHSGPVLSREQLRGCVAQQKNLNAEGKSLDASEAALQAKAAEIEKLEATIKLREPLVDQYSQKSVDSFNALIGKHKRFVAAYNSSLLAYNAKVEKLKVENKSFNARCAGHAYYESDMQAVLAGK